MCSIILVVVVAIFGCFAMRVAHGHARAIAKQLSLARAIATGDDTEFADEAAEESTLLRNAFDSFDADGSESIDQDEARRLLNLMYPLKSRSFHKKALSAIPDTSSVSYDQFDHLVREWREMAQTDGATAEGNLQSVQSSAQQAGKHAGTCLSLLTSSVSSVRSHGRPRSQVRHTTTTTTRTSDTAVGNVQADSANASGGAEDVRDSSSLALEISSDRGLEEGGDVAAGGASVRWWRLLKCCPRVCIAARRRRVLALPVAGAIAIADRARYRDKDPS
jgi:hypothetical protein